MNGWASLHNHSDFSLLDGLSKPTAIIERCVDVGITTVALSDHGSISGAPDFLDAKKKVIEKFESRKKRAKTQEKIDLYDRKIMAVKTLKQILACEFYLSEQDSTIRSKENGQHSHLVVLAKNQPGWKSLLKLTAMSNRKEHFYKKPRLNLERFAEHAGNLVTFSGHMGSDLANCIFTNIKLAYNARTYEEAKTLIDPEWKKKATALVGKYQEIFGRENFLLEIQMIDQDNLPAAKIVGQALRWISKKLGVPAVATADAHYPTHEDARDQRVLICNLIGTTFPKVQKNIDSDQDIGLGGFFRSSNYHIPTPEEIAAVNTEEEIKNSLVISDMCTADYRLFGQPSIPKFNTPDGISSTEYLTQLCRKGFKERIRGRVPAGFTEQQYVDRIKEELAVINGTSILPDYFLIVQDFVSKAREKGIFVGPSRGSCGGCLTAYLAGITAIDPIFYDLSFARFYNAGRNTKDRIALPDIDCDFPTEYRQSVIEFCREKYGRGNVAQMCTFSRMMGRAVVKDVLRVHGVASEKEMNDITEFIPDESLISGDLQTMREEGEEPSIVKWALQNNKKQLKDWCFINDQGKLEGRFAQYFAQAIRLEGTKRGASKHPSGVAIASFNIEDKVPMIRDKSSDGLLVGVDMRWAEKMELPKFDILGVACLGKTMGVSQLLAQGEIDE